MAVLGYVHTTVVDLFISHEILGGGMGLKSNSNLQI